MPDEITGVVVLQQFRKEGIWACWFEYTKADGFRDISYIPMVERGSTAPIDHHGPLWQFVRRNPWLDCSPSVRILGPENGKPDHFHNQGQWSNHYVQMIGPWESEPEGRDLCYEINGFGNELPITKEFRDSIILPYRAKGILL